MKRLDITDIVGIDLREFKRPSVDHIAEKRRAGYVNRCNAVMAVAGGASVRAAATECDVDPRTIKRDVVHFLLVGPDGHPLGFRACLPYAVRTPKSRTDETIKPPIHKGPYAFTRLLTSTPALQTLVDAYHGALPDGRAKCSAFDRHFKAFKASVRAAHGDDTYPFNTVDDGRGALLTHHQRVRQARLDAGAAEVEATEPAINRFNQLFGLQPLDRIEYDAHKIDTDWVLQIPRPDGHMVHKRIECVTLMALICAVSRYLIAYVLVLGTYNRLDVLRLFHHALQAWRPRRLCIPGMVYPEGAQLGLPIDSTGAGPRGVLIAGDNALAHHADLTVDNLLDHHRGILNLGHAHVPEGRPHIEALFRLLEQGALRHLAGSFQPETRTSGKKVRTSYLRAEDHPMHWEGLLDLMDVIAAGYNVTPHSGLNNRTPASVMNAHLASGWAWQATESARDAQKLTTVRFNARIRGDKSVGRHPFVQYHDAYYRSQRLMGRWDQVGNSFVAEANVEDLRHIVLLDRSDGTPWSRLTALAPWNISPHDLHLRQQIIRARNRGLIEIAGAHDAVAVYHDFTHTQTLSGETPPDLYARIAVQQGSQQPMPSIPTPRQAVQPRAGRVTFAKRKD
jgi:putative transposase